MGALSSKRSWKKK